MSKLEALKTLMLSNSGCQNDYLDLVDEIVKREAKDIILQGLQPDWDIHETKKNKKKLIKAFERVLKYYCTKDEWEAFIHSTYGVGALEKKPYYER